MHYASQIWHALKACPPTQVMQNLINILTHSSCANCTHFIICQYLFYFMPKLMMHSQKEGLFPLFHYIKNISSSKEVLLFLKTHLSKFMILC